MINIRTKMSCTSFIRFSTVNLSLVYISRRYLETYEETIFCVWKCGWQNSACSKKFYLNPSLVFVIHILFIPWQSERCRFCLYIHERPRKIPNSDEARSILFGYEKIIRTAMMEIYRRKKKQVQGTLKKRKY